MKNYIKNIAGIFFMILLTAIISCKKDGPKPCVSNLPFKANFQVGENIYADTIPETDTILSFNAICKASENYAEVTWQIGSEANTRSGRSTVITFGLHHLGLTIPITMYAKSWPDKCYPNQQYYDTVTKYVTIKYSKEFKPHLYPHYPEHAVKPAIIGIYRGAYQDAPKDSFEVVVAYNGPNTDGALRIALDFNLYNLPKGCFKKILGVSVPVECQPFTRQSNYQTFYGKRFSGISNTGFAISLGDSGDCCPWADGFGVYDTKTNTLRVKEITDWPDPPFKRVRYFVGKKIG